MYLPKQRGMDSFRLSREDLTPNRASAQMDNFDFHSMARNFTPHKYTDDDIPDIPVYNRERNSIRRFSRIVSSPEKSHTIPLLAYPSSENATTSQPAPVGPKFGENVQSEFSVPVFKNDKVRERIGQRTVSESIRPAEKSTLSSNLTNRGASRIHEWISRRPSPTSSDIEAGENECETIGIDRDARKNQDHNFGEHTSKSEFPAFVPQFVPRRRTSSNQKPDNTVSSAEPAYDESFANLKIDEVASESTPQTSASSRMSAFESGSSNSYASSETELSSVDMCEPLDIPSYYEKSGDSLSFMDDSLFDSPNSEPEVPPEPPKHQIQRRVQSEKIADPKNIDKFRPLSTISAKSSSFDFCLDSGADYDKSRFMIPKENRVSGPRAKIQIDHIIIKKRDGVKNQTGNVRDSVDQRRSASSGARIFSNFKNGVGKMLK